jgi:hypothetical protein
MTDWLSCGPTNADQEYVFHAQKKHPQKNLQTWHYPDGRKFNQIDHCIIDEDTSGT